MATTTTKRYKTSRDKRRDIAARYAAAAQGLTLARSRTDRRYRIWRETELGDGLIRRETVAGGADGLTLDEAEELIRSRALAEPSMAG